MLPEAPPEATPTPGVLAGTCRSTRPLNDGVELLVECVVDLEAREPALAGKLVSEPQIGEVKPLRGRPGTVVFANRCVTWLAAILTNNPLG